MAGRAQMRIECVPPQGHIRGRGSATGRSKSYLDRKNSQANSQLQVETFLKAADYRNTGENLPDP